MTQQKGMGFYHVGAENVYSTVEFTIVASTTQAPTFESLFSSTGLQSTAPFTSEITSPATNDFIAQARLDAVVRAISVYMQPVKVYFATTSVTNDTIKVSFPSTKFGLPVTTADLTETIGLGGNAAKTKPGIQTLLNAILANGSAPASLDGGNTYLFAANPNLADGTVSTAAAVTALTATVGTVVV